MIRECWKNMQKGYTKDKIFIRNYGIHILFEIGVGCRFNKESVLKIIDTIPFHVQIQSVSNILANNIVDKTTFNVILRHYIAIIKRSLLFFH